MFRMTLIFVSVSEKNEEINLPPVPSARVPSVRPMSLVF